MILMNNPKKNIDYNEKILQVKNLKTVFRVGSGKKKIKINAVNDISFDIYKREVFGLVGESGCGKTTASRTIIRLYRPTGGEVVFEGQTVGSGPNEYYRTIKYETIKYKNERLKLNKAKYELHQINLDYDEKISLIQESFSNVQQKYESELLYINSAVENYKKDSFELRNTYNIDKDELLFNFTQAKDELYDQTVNKEEVQYKEEKKRLDKAHKIRVTSIKESIGLDKENIEKQLKLAEETYKNDLKTVEHEYQILSNTPSEPLMSRADYRTELKFLKKKHKEDLTILRKEFLNSLNGLKKPNREQISQETKELKLKYQDQFDKLDSEIRLLNNERKEKLKTVDKNQTVDRIAIKELKETYKALIKEQKEKIKMSRDRHFTKMAKEQSKRMQMIFQDPISSLNPRMTVGEIISEGLVIRGEKDKEILKEKVVRILKIVGLAPEYISRYPHEFSGGQRQRIGIARALIMEPSFIIADEPISALDVSIRAQVLNLLTELKDELDLTILFIAHDLSVVKFFCDRIAVMYAGKIVEMASSEDLFNNPIHPYTKSLLSAVPQPVPDIEKKKQRITYNPMMHDYSQDQPELIEINPGHFVLANQAEFELYKKQKGDKNA